MSVYKGNVTYFESPGFLNTDSVIEVTKERLKMRDVAGVIVPMTTGRTLEKFVKFPSASMCTLVMMMVALASAPSN